MRPQDGPLIVKSLRLASLDLQGMLCTLSSPSPRVADEWLNQNGDHGRGQPRARTSRLTSSDGPARSNDADNLKPVNIDLRDRF